MDFTEKYSLTKIHIFPCISGSEFKKYAIVISFVTVICFCFCVAAAACVYLNFVSFANKETRRFVYGFCCCYCCFFVLFFVFFAKTHLTCLTYNVISPDHVNRRSLILAKMCLGMINEHLQKSKLSAWLKIASKKSVAST